MNSLGVLLIAVGVAGVVWARWMPRKMAAVREEAVARGRGDDFDARWPSRTSTLALRVVKGGSWLVIPLGVLILVL